MDNEKILYKDESGIVKVKLVNETNFIFIGLITLLDLIPYREISEKMEKTLQNKKNIVIDIRNVELLSSAGIKMILLLIKYVADKKIKANLTIKGSYNIKWQDVNFDNFKKVILRHNLENNVILVRE